MRRTRIILSRSRAVDYFVPGSCDADSDWDFYCEDFILSVTTFLYWSTHLDVVWQARDRSAVSEPDASFYDGIGLQLVRDETRRDNTVHRM
jgi:hypothetical protein